MRRKGILVFIILIFVAEGLLCFFFASKMGDISHDNVLINECLKSVGDNYGNEAEYKTLTDYVVIDNDGNVMFRTSAGLSESIQEAVRHGDTILDVESGRTVVGKAIFYNDTPKIIASYRNSILITVVTASAIQTVSVIFYYMYLQKTIIRPFVKFNEFAVRIAGGDLDVPLTVDREHIFGSFTEAFDLMRSELKKARASEKKANDDKKEMVAKLSHDIKTPVASVKSTSEIGYEVTKEEKTKQYFNLINVKADQITVLVDNLFNSSVSDVTEITVNPVPCDASSVNDMIRSADYLGKAGEFSIPDVRIFADKLRLQQAFDNIFMNSYKYADTPISVDISVDGSYLAVRIADKGPGVSSEELPLLKEKYKRGSNVEGKDGAGLGLFLTDYFITNMDGRLTVENAEPGLAVTFYLRTVN
ncbi:MAG: HAMP domain-containing histidine kinase [Clostridiales bacterium]|nr:HAMP domain-containing histidine kinase [Clostridiales bacterium]